MIPAALSERLDAMIDDLIMEGGVESASLASILLAARESLNREDLVALSRQVWAANDEIRSRLEAEDATPPSEALEETRERVHAG